MVQQTSNILNEDVWCIGEPDPDISGLKVTGWRLVLLPVRQKNKTASGVHIPDSTIDDLQTLTSLCKVLQVGDQAYSTDVYDGSVWCTQGDFVLIPRTVGMKIKYNGVPLVICSDKDVYCVVSDPQKLDKVKYSM